MIVSRIATIVLIALFIASSVSSAAFADADPASDVLLGENVFYPYNPPVASSLQAALNAETAAAHRAHLPIKVALIATPVDLGAIPTFFGKPRQYAAFLDQEISFGGRVPLLVVMPDGYGTAGLPPAATAAAASLARPSSATSNALAQAALTAVRRLAAASGHGLGGGSSGSGGRSSGSSPALPLAIVAIVCVLLAAGILTWRRRRPSPASRRR